jgi:hypothetical protein
MKINRFREAITSNLEDTLLWHQDMLTQDVRNFVFNRVDSVYAPLRRVALSISTGTIATVAYDYNYDKDAKNHAVI